MLLVCGIVAQIVNEVAPVHIQHGADGDEVTEADVLLQAPVQDGGAERAALADEADVAAAGDGGGEGGVKAGYGAHHAQAVRADDAHIAAAGMLEDLALELGAFRTGFLEAGGDDDGALSRQCPRLLR